MLQTEDKYPREDRNPSVPVLVLDRVVLSADPTQLTEGGPVARGLLSGAELRETLLPSDTGTDGRTRGEGERLGLVLFTNS